MHVGVVLPTFGVAATPSRVRDAALTAEALGYDSVWTTQHFIVGREAAIPYGSILDALATLSWVAGFTEHIGLGTSVAILPLHHPVQLAKEMATLQLLSGGRAYLGVGVGWHRDEFEFMSVDFASRGQRTDESLALIEALWAGERSFHGSRWAFDDAAFAPVPERPPQIWIGGNGPRALKRALAHGGIWHPTARPTAVLTGADQAQTHWPTIDEMRRAKEQWPGLKVVPRLAGVPVEQLPTEIAALASGELDGVVVGFTLDQERLIEAMTSIADAVLPERRRVAARST
jgi:probable F420-dependent oxidoreductase